METIAITDWNDVVSPLYDAACCFRIVRPDGTIASLNVRNSSLLEKADLCKSKGVSVLICGAISTIARILLQEREIKVLSWIGGSVDEVLDAYRNNINITTRFAMPGCCRRSSARESSGHCHRRNSAAHHLGRQTNQ